MVIDSSALIAILVNEPERSRFVDLIAGDPTRLVSAAGRAGCSARIEANQRGNRALRWRGWGST